jgi:UDP-perosamine 4-acetyltransferase
MKIVKKIVVEKFNTSDVEYKLIEVNVKNSQFVSVGEKLFSLESSKTIIDIESTVSGWIIFDLQQDQTVKVGDVIAILYDKELTQEQISIELKNEKLIQFEKVSIESSKFSKKALNLIKENNLDKALFSKFEFVKEGDVFELLKFRNNKFTLPTNNKEDLILLGGKGGAKMCIDAIRSTNKFKIIGIIDDALIPGSKVMDIEVLGGENELHLLFKNGYKNLVVTYSILNDLSKRYLKIEQYQKIGFSFPNIIHEKAVIESSSRIGNGNIILANSIIGSEAIVGDFNYINTASIICHESLIGNNNHFAPNSVIAGRVKVGDSNLFGMCTTTYFDICIGSNNILNNGVSLNNDILNNNIVRK